MENTSFNKGESPKQILEIKKKKKKIEHPAYKIKQVIKSRITKTGGSQWETNRTPSWEDIKSTVRLAGGIREMESWEDSKCAPNSTNDANCC